MNPDLATEPAKEAQISGSGGASEPAAEPKVTDGTARSEAPEPEPEAVVEDPAASRSRLPLLYGSAVLVVASFFGPIASSGIWEPPELKVADLARRIGATLLGTPALASEGGNNLVPTAAELGRGELPFTSIALGMKLLGLSDWTGRIPMAAWGVVGVLSTVLLLGRLADKVTAAFGAIVLATMPLYFLQARTMLGDIVTFAALALATAGLGVATFDGRPSFGRRAVLFVLGLVGLAAGFGSRGVLIGITIPALSVGLAHRIHRNRADGAGNVFGGLSLLVGVTAAIIGTRALVASEPHHYSRILAGVVEIRRGTLTHDAMVLLLGHGIFPWSAIVPFALSSLLRAPPGVDGERRDREVSLRALLGISAIVGFGVYTALGPVLGTMPFGPVFALAATVAITARDLERGAPMSRSVILGVASLLILFYTDFKNFPDKGLAPFAVEDARFPDSFKVKGDQFLKYGSVLTAALFALFAYERDRGQKTFARKEYAIWPRTLRTAYDGNVWVTAVAVEASLVAVALASVLSDHGVKIKLFAAVIAPLREVSRFAFLVFPVVVLLPSLALVARDLCRITLRFLRVTRGSAALASIAAFGAVLSFAYYPLLARQISPKESFESFRRVSRPGEELGMVGATAAGSARYYANRDVRTLANPQEAFTWLTGDQAQRRWLVIRATDLGQLNSQFRGLERPPRNLPVVDARSSEILLVSNLLRAGEKNENPLAEWVLESRPRPERPLDVDFNEQLRGIGWGVTRPDGTPVNEVRAGKQYLFKLYYEVVRPITGEWQTFIHIDGYQRRYNGDHDTLRGKYSFHLWRVGDYIVDIHPFELEPNFTAGTYNVFYGLFRGDQRLAVKRGGGDDNRVNAGPLEVR